MLRLSNSDLKYLKFEEMEFLLLKDNLMLNKSISFTPVILASEDNYIVRYIIHSPDLNIPEHKEALLDMDYSLFEKYVEEYANEEIYISTLAHKLFPYFLKSLQNEFKGILSMYDLKHNVKGVIYQNNEARGVFNSLISNRVISGFSDIYVQNINTRDPIDLYFERNGKTFKINPDKRILEPYELEGILSSRDDFRVDIKITDIVETNNIKIKDNRKFYLKKENYKKFKEESLLAISKYAIVFDTKDMLSHIDIDFEL